MMKKILAASIGIDVHIAGILNFRIKREGYEVVNLAQLCYK